MKNKMIMMFLQSVTQAYNCRQKKKLWAEIIFRVDYTTSAQVVKTSVNATNKSSFQNYTKLDDHSRQTLLKIQHCFYFSSCTDTSHPGPLGMSLHTSFSGLFSLTWPAAILEF